SALVAPPDALGAAVHHQRLAADIVAVGAAEEVDGAGRLGGGAAATERDDLVHRGDARALHADPHLAPLDLDRAGPALGERLGEALLDVPEGDAVDRHVVAPPLLRERPRHAHHRRLARRVVHLARVAVDAGGRRDVDDLAHDALALLGLRLDS